MKQHGKIMWKSYLDYVKEEKLSQEPKTEKASGK